MPVHQIEHDNTYWIFVSDSDEPRHLRDIVFAVDALRKRRTPLDRVIVFTDHQAPRPHLCPFGISEIAPLSEFGPRLSSLRGCNNAIVVVTGHGNVFGVGAVANRPVLSPHSIMSSVRAIPALGVAVIVLTQCYAGIFDRVDARTEPPLVLIGATGLNLSLSTAVKLRAPIKQADGSDAFDEWLANIFLVCFFDWIANPRDVDGDGALTIADAYKFAGAQSNKHLVQLKSTLYFDAANQSTLVQQLERAARTSPTQQVTAMAAAAARTKLQEILAMLYLHQEPWILHADLARDVRLGSVATTPLPLSSIT